MSYKYAGSMRYCNMKTGRDVPAVISYDGKYWMANPELVEIGMKDEYERLSLSYHGLKGSAK